MKETTRTSKLIVGGALVGILLSVFIISSLCLEKGCYDTYLSEDLKEFRPNILGCFFIILLFSLIGMGIGLVIKKRKPILIGIVVGGVYGSFLLLIKLLSLMSSLGIGEWSFTGLIIDVLLLPSILFLLLFLKITGNEIISYLLSGVVFAMVGGLVGFIIKKKKKIKNE